MPQKKLTRLIHRTQQLHDAIQKINFDMELVSEERFILSYKAGLLSFEHAKAALLLIENELHSPGFSLYRPQFESLVRGIWLLHAASDEWIEKLSKPLTEDNFRKANQSLMLADMIKELDNSSAPPHLIHELKSYRDATWKALNSYAHSGFLPLALAEFDYPPELGIDAILNSNALVSINAQLFTIVSGVPINMAQVRDLLVKFNDCIPIL
jgi:hypothetical protein